VGHLDENKGYHRAVEVAAQILPKHPDWKWIICGEGPERNRLETMLAKAGLQEQMKLLGLVTDMDSMYAQAAILVMTSEMEGLPMVLLEGKAHGLPLVAFDIMTGPSDIIDDGINGYLTEPFDTDAMAQKLETLMTDHALRLKMSENAAVGMDKFLEETILHAWETLLKE
jgi:glycosyltransferase involved in cell wall biosynthesis